MDGIIEDILLGDPLEPDSGHLGVPRPHFEAQWAGVLYYFKRKHQNKRPHWRVILHTAPKDKQLSEENSWSYVKCFL